jgi:hypothetical protein
VKIAGLGCFTQDGKDTNKYYHGAVVQHKTSKKWYAYFEWGRTGAAKPSFRFVQCGSEQEAQREFQSQLHSKNDRRGEWITIASIRTLQARSGKDCYLVRPMATRSTGLPDARSIKINEGAKTDKVAAATDEETTVTGKKKATKKVAKKKGPKIDDPTRAFLRDLSVATIASTRGSMADDSIPTQTAIDEARSILSEAQSRLVKIDGDVKKQLKDKQLKQMTTLMYGRIPKKKALRAAPEEWMLNKDNILVWQNDLDAFESALYATDIDQGEAETNPLEELGLKMEWISPTSPLGKKLYKWWPTPTATPTSAICRSAIYGRSIAIPTRQTESGAGQDYQGQNKDHRTRCFNSRRAPMCLRTNANASTILTQRCCFMEHAASMCGGS